MLLTSRPIDSMEPCTCSVNGACFRKLFIWQNVYTYHVCN